MSEELLDKAPCGYFAFFDDGSIFKANEALASALNYSKDQLMGKNVEFLLTLSSRIFYQTHLFPLIKLQGKADEIFLTLLSSDGTHIPVLLNANRIRHQDLLVTSCAMIVVPNRKKFEDELLNARKTAENALKENTELLESKEAFQVQTENLDRQIQQVKRQNYDLKQVSFVITHNLKEPLRKIQLYTTKLKNELQSLTIEKLQRSTDQMEAVVGGLQQYVWLNRKENEFVRLDLNEVLSLAVQRLTEETGKDLLTLTTGELHMIDGDNAQLQLMFYHLLDNAIKFRRGNLASVSVRSTVLKKNVFRNIEAKYRYEDQVRIEIRDEGIGFSSEYRHHIFDLFRKLEITPGQGLGLALCRQVVENHLGHIEAETEPNVFTRIIIWLPVTQNSAINPPSNPESI